MLWLVSLTAILSTQLRHLGASVLDRAGKNIGDIQRLLGHEHRNTTEIYLHSIGDSLRETMSVFDEISEKSHTVG